MDSSYDSSQRSNGNELGNNELHGGRSSRRRFVQRGLHRRAVLRLLFRGRIRELLAFPSDPRQLDQPDPNSILLTPAIPIQLLARSLPGGRTGVVPAGAGEGLVLGER